MKKDSKNVLFVALILTVLFLCFYFPNKMTEMKHNQTSLLQFVAEVQAKEDFLQSNFELNSQMTGLRAPELFCMINNNEGRLLSVMTEDKPVLIYRFTNKSCEECYIDALTVLQKEIQTAFSENPDLVAVLCSHQTERELMILKRTYKFSFPIYKIPFDAFDWVAEESNKPYYFVLHPGMKISHIYVPKKGYPELNRQYFESVKRLLLE